MDIQSIFWVLALSTLMGYVSFKTKKTTTAIGIGISLSVFYMIGSKFVSLPGIKYLLNAIPMASSSILQSMYDFSISLGNWESYAIILEISILFILSTIVLAIDINKK